MLAQVHTIEFEFLYIRINIKCVYEHRHVEHLFVGYSIHV